MAGHIAGAISVPVEDLQRRLKELARARNTSRIAADRTVSTQTGRWKSSVGTDVGRDGWSKGFPSGDPRAYPLRAGRSQEH